VSITEREEKEDGKACQQCRDWHSGEGRLCPICAEEFDEKYADERLQDEREKEHDERDTNDL
jgi:predicted amidophosphoribosyltransferase